MEISSIIAQEIVMQMKEVLAHEINFMNSEAVIIASTDKNRIGQFHEGAFVVLQTDEALTILDDTRFDGSKKGINIPVSFENEVIGVVGITGDKQIVEKYGAIIKKMTEILIKEDFLKDLNKKKRERSHYIISTVLNHHLYDPSFETTPVFTYDYTSPHLAIIGSFVEEINFQYEELYRIVDMHLSSLEKSIYLVKDNKLYIFTKETDSQIIKSDLLKLSHRISELYKGLFSFGIGPISQSLAQAHQAFGYAQETLVWNMTQLKKPVMFFDELDIGLVASGIDVSRRTLIKQKVIGSIPANERDYLKKVFITYGDYNKSITQSADKLYIHKNSFQYSLNKIKTYTGYDPKVLNDYVLLYLAFLLDGY